jgi:hypothetical protein
MQKGEGSRRLGNRRHAKEAADRTEMGLGRSAQPVLRPNRPPFVLGASRAIYSPLTESHALINSSSAAEEQRSLRDTISEIRVVLVVYGLPSRRGNLAWKTTSELQSKDQDRGRFPMVMLFM